MLNILLIGFNRSEFLKRQLRTLQNVDGIASVVVVIDGPRVSNTFDMDQQNDFKNWLATFSPRYDLETIFGTKNRGCKEGVEFAIDYFFDSHNDGIILEDDCRVDLQFFDLYKHYKSHLDDSRIFMLTACSFAEVASPDKIFLSRYPHIWGWATTADNWRNYRNTGPNYSVSNFIKTIFKNSFVENVYFAPKWLQAWRKQIDTWDYDLSYYMLTNRKLCIVPGLNFVKNIGINNGGMHDLNLSDDLTNKNLGLNFNLSTHLCSSVEVLYDRSILKRRLRNKLRKFLRRC